jgi:hypothetical protein
MADYSFSKRDSGYATIGSGFYAGAVTAFMAVAFAVQVVNNFSSRASLL